MGRLKTSVFVQDPKGVYVELDLFDDESIELTKTIKTIRDPAKVFTPFSKTFTVPASPKNNDVFTYWYEAINIGSSIDGFVKPYDGRFTAKARISVNGIVVERGVITMRDAEVLSGKAKSYTVIFQGSIKELRDIFRDDDLSSLVYLQQLNHDYLPATVMTMFRGGMNRGSSPTSTGGYYDICYPFITHTKNFVFNNGEFSTLTRDGIEVSELEYTDLKPAVKIAYILEAIRVQYDYAVDLDFSELENMKGGSLWFNRLYMWCHREEGPMKGAGIDQQVVIPFTELTYLSGDEIAEGDNGFIASDEVRIQYNVTPDPTNRTYDVEIINENTGLVVESFPNQIGTGIYSAALFSQDFRPSLRVVSRGEVNTITVTSVTVIVSEGFDQQIGQYEASALPYNVFSTLDVRSQIPKMKITDFIRGICNMFNLVVYYEESTEKVVFMSYDDYMDKLGDPFVPTVDQPTKIWDVSDGFSNEYKVERSQLYRRIDFEWEGDGTYLARERNARVNAGDNYGFLSYDEEGQTFAGDDFKIELPFEKVLFQRLGEGDVPSNITAGAMVDEDSEPYVGAPLIFFNRNKSVSPDVIPVESTISGADITGNYNAPANEDAVNPVNPQTINWNAEVGAETLNIETSSLFEVFWKNWVKRIFDVRMRLVRVKTLMPMDFNIHFRLWQRVRFKSKIYLVNEYTLNLNTGEGQMELIPALSEGIEVQSPEEQQQQNQAPIAVDDNVSVPLGGSVVINVLANDYDPDGDEIGNVQIVSLPVNGDVFVNPDNTVTYVNEGIAAKPGFNTENDTFTYTMTDGALTSNVATVFISIGNTPPTAVDDTVYVNFDDIVTVPVLDNDFDLDGDPITIVSVTQGVNGGSVSLGSKNGVQSVTYRHFPSVGNSDVFTYTISDGTATDVGTVQVFVNDGAPVAIDDFMFVTTGGVGSVAVLNNDTDPENGTLGNVVIVDQPSHGTVSVDTDTWIVTYTHNGNAAVSDSFTYTMTDGLNVSNEATVFVTIDQPLATVIPCGSFVSVPKLTINEFDVETGQGVNSTHFDFMTRDPGRYIVRKNGVVLYDSRWVSWDTIQQGHPNNSLIAPLPYYIPGTQTEAFDRPYLIDPLESGPGGVALLFTGGTRIYERRRLDYVPGQSFNWVSLGTESVFHNPSDLVVGFNPQHGGLAGFTYNSQTAESETLNVELFSYTGYPLITLANIEYEPGLHVYCNHTPITPSIPTPQNYEIVVGPLEGSFDLPVFDGAIMPVTLFRIVITEIVINGNVRTPSRYGNNNKLFDSALGANPVASPQFYKHITFRPQISGITSFKFYIITSDNRQSNEVEVFVDITYI